MNYNSIEEILSSGTTNMQVIRNNTKNDDGTDVIDGVSWFTYDEVVASNIHVSGNSWIGFGSYSEQLKVNRRDGAMYSLYREEGTLYEYYKFLKIRWKGYSYYNQTTSAYAVEYDVILWDTGDISLHMISIPTASNDGDYSLIASSAYSYTVSTLQPDVTFKRTATGFEVSNTIINLEPPYEKRYLIRSGSTYYTVLNNVLSEINVLNLESSTFLTYGVEFVPPFSLLAELSEPEILFWKDNDSDLETGLSVEGIPPLPQIVYYDIQDMTGYNGIQRIESKGTNDVLLSISFDNGQTWKYYKNNAWHVVTSDTDGMSIIELSHITPEAWSNIITNTSYQLRCVLPSAISSIGNIYVKYN